VAQADPLQRRSDSATGGTFTGTGQQLEVLPAGQMGVEPGFVNDGTDPCQRPVAVLRDRIAEQGHGAGVSVGQSEQNPDEGRLAGAVGPQVAEGASAGDEELYPIHGDVLPEPLGQTMGLDGPLALASMPVRGPRDHCGAHLPTWWTAT
jgi:hypothetical protein